MKQNWTDRKGAPHSVERRLGLYEITTARSVLEGGWGFDRVRGTEDDFTALFAEVYRPIGDRDRRPGETFTQASNRREAELAATGETPDEYWQRVDQERPKPTGLKPS